MTTKRNLNRRREDKEKEEKESPELTKGERRELADRIMELEPLTVREIAGRLGELGYRAQPEAVRAAAVFGYRHVQRLRRDFVFELPTEGLPPRQHLLFAGASGCGKTHLVELLFGKVLGLPYTIEDATQYTETGYVGNSTPQMLANLRKAAGGDRAWASVGVVVVDEFDKIASSRNSGNHVFGGGSQTEPGGYGVQRELLGMLSGQVAKPSGSHPFKESEPPLPLRHVAFVCAGAFAGLAGMADDGDGASIGFGGKPRQKSGSPFARLGGEVVDRITPFVRYGIMPELMGRLRVVPFQPLEESELREILRDKVLSAVGREFAEEGLALHLTRPAVTHIVGEALKRGTGARGLWTGLASIIDRVAWDAFATPAAGRVTIGWSARRGLVHRVEGRSGAERTGAAAERPVEAFEPVEAVG